MSRRGAPVNAPISQSDATPSSSSRSSRVDRPSNGLTQAATRQPNVSRISSAPGAANSATRRTRDLTPSMREAASNGAKEKKPKTLREARGTSTPAAAQRRAHATDPGKRNPSAGNALTNQGIEHQQSSMPGGVQPNSIATGQVRGRSLPAPMPEAAARPHTPSRPNPLLAGSTSPKSASSGTPGDVQALTTAPAAMGRSVPTPSFRDADMGSAVRTPSQGPARPNPLLSNSPKRERSLSRGPSAAADLGLFGNMAGATDDIHLKVETESAASSSEESKKGKSTRSAHEKRRSKPRREPDKTTLAPAAFLSSMFSVQPEESQQVQAPRRGSSSTRRKMANEAQAKRGQTARGDHSTSSLPLPSSQRGVGRPAHDQKMAPWDVESEQSVEQSPKKQAEKKQKVHAQLSSNSLSSDKEDTGARPDFPRSASNSSNSFGTTPSFSRDKSMKCTAEFGIPSVEEAKALQENIKGKEKARETESMSHSSMLSSDRRNRRAVIQEISSPATPVSNRGHNKPIRQISGFMSNFRDESSPMKTKVPLAQLTTQTPLVVRLTHIQDLRAATALILGTKVPAYSQLGYTLHEQRALGESLQRTDAVALSRWYLPYSLLVLLYIGSVILAGLTEEFLSLCMPLFVVFPVLHYLRLWRCDWLLCKAVDSGALAQFQEQLKPPLGWGTSNQVFTATLTAAMQAFQPAPRRLFAHPPQQFSRTPLIVAGTGLVLLGIFRVLRVMHVATPLEAEIAISSVALVFLVVLGCSPLNTRPRSSEADLRLSMVEAAFNALLDTMRPLMGDARGAGGLGASPKIAQAPLALAPAEALHGAEAASHGRFSVRLVTSDRNTLRAALHICGPWQQLAPFKQEPGTAAICVSCALGGFSVMAEHLEGATPMDLGASAAGAGELAGHAGTSPQGPTSLEATMGIHLGRDSRPRHRADDEVSVSLASVSTASTLRRGGNNGPSQASLTKAMSMVTKICARHDPLEVFRGNNGMAGAIVPSKTILDEPALLLALSEGQSDVLAGAQCPEQLMRFVADAQTARRWLACFGCCRPSMHVPREAEDAMGVLRNDMELRQLCRANAGVGPFGTPASSQHATTPGSRQHDSDLDTSSDDEDRERASRPNPVDGHLMNLSNTTSKHLAVIFDSAEERNRCLAMLGQARLLPERAKFADSGPWP